MSTNIYDDNDLIITSFGIRKGEVALQLTPQSGHGYAVLELDAVKDLHAVLSAWIQEQEERNT